MHPADIGLDDLDRDPHAVFHGLREHGPVTWVPVLDGWVVLSRDVAVAVMRDAERFTVDDPRFSTAQVVGPSMLSLDGQEHLRHRTPFVDGLRPAEVAATYADRIERAAFGLVASFRDDGRAELRRRLAGPLAVDVAASVLGLDALDAPALLAIYDVIVAAVDGVSQGVRVPQDARDAFERLAAAVAVAGERPGSLVARAATHLAPAEVVANSAVFLFGGIETSEGMTTNALAHVLGDAEQRALVEADPALVDVAVEESLRLEPAASRVDRYATTDVSIDGAHIRRGDLVIVSLSAANRDPAVFTDPDRFDVRRANARSHLAFATGPHACLGAQLARLETRAAVVAVLTQLDGITVDASFDTRGVIFRKPSSLDATWAVP